MTLKSTFIALAFLLSMSLSFAQGSYTYTGKPRFNIETRRGGVFLANIQVELFPNIAPKHVRNFDSLVSVGFYDTTAFHRCIPGFMIQGGDPNSRSGPMNTWGYGQVGQPTVPAEFSAAKHLRGILSAARSTNINSATSQFFICVAAAPSLNNLYSVYGRVTSGMNYADTIVLTPKGSGSYSNTPLQKMEMFITYIGSNDTVPVAPIQDLPTNGSTDHDYLFAVSCKWLAVSDAIIYELEVSTDSLFATVTEPIVKTANLSSGINNLQSNTKYFWRVRANNGGHFSAYSPVRSFKTMRDPSDPTGIKTNKSNKEADLVYPNPGHGKFNFKNLEPGSSIEIFDAKGKSVYKSVIKDTLLALDFETKDKGVYFYKINSGAKSTEGKFILE